MTTQAELVARLRGRRPGHTLPREFYNDPEIYRADLDAIFHAQWLFAGHDAEIPAIGDYFTISAGEYPVIVVRGRDGEIRAFHNTCRHRGSRICSAARGSSVRLVCPYHNWSYDLDGRLLFARDMGKPFDPAPLGLKPVACETAGGYIFVCVAANPPDFEGFRRAMTPYFERHRLAQAKLAHETTTIENGNWKLVWENNRECYHCSPNHPELCRTFPESPTVAGVAGALADPEIAAHFERMEKLGLPSRFQLSAQGDYRLARMPLIPGVLSYTMSGQAAVKRPLSDDIAEPSLGTLMLFNYPSTWNHVLADHAVTFRVTPLGPTQTAVTTKWLVHKDAVEGVDYTIDELIHVWDATNDQDRRIVEENQIGVNSPAYEPGPYSPVQEGGVVQFIDWYAGAMERALERRARAGRVA